TVSIRTIHHTVGSCPVHRRHSIGSDLAFICEVLPGTGAGASGIPPKDGGNLLPADRVIGSKQAVAVAADDSLLGSPENRVGVPGALLGICKGITAGDRGTSGLTVKRGGQHGPGHG